MRYVGLLQLRPRRVLSTSGDDTFVASKTKKGVQMDNSWPLSFPICPQISLNSKSQFGLNIHSNRQAAQCFMSSTISLSHSRSLNMTPLSRSCIVCRIDMFVLVFNYNYVYCISLTVSVIQQHIMM